MWIFDWRLPPCYLLRKQTNFIFDEDPVLFLDTASKQIAVRDLVYTELFL